MIKIDLYDWDGTITKNKHGMDTSVHFLLFCITKKPSILKIFPSLLLAFKTYRAGKITMTEFKEVGYSYLPLIAADPKLRLEELVIEFTEKYMAHVYGWVSPNKNHHSIVISASPAFLIEGMCNDLGFNGLIATDVNPETGQITGHNCRKEIKIIMLADYIKEHFPKEGFEIINVYSDTITGNDANIALLGQHAFLITKDGRCIKTDVNQSMARYDLFPEIESTPEQLRKLVK